jgi:hypothetical protein
MNRYVHFLSIVFFILSIIPCNSQTDFSTSKPWTYWWWMGSAVDTFNLSRNLEMMQQSGLGGAHIIPIYGVKGEEENYIEYLSPEWQKMLGFTSGKADELGLGIDMTMGTGWCFGGKTLDETNGCMAIHTESIKVDKDTVIELSGKSRYLFSEVINILALFDDGRRKIITDYRKESNQLRWAEKTKATIYISSIEGPVYKVKRAAPGGEGFMLDPFSANAFIKYTHSFDTAFEKQLGKYIRSIYHDSYEYYGANWTKDLFDSFRSSRGYDLRLYLPELYGNGDSSISDRILADYRQTIAELHLEYVSEIKAWAEKHGLDFRNQSHGAPANLLDVYAAAGIPETETFGSTDFKIKGLTRESEFIREEEPNPFIMKFASSAAHVTGKPLISSETHTWLRDHFRVALSHCKPEIDQLFLAGINHIFYHGTTYSPVNADWPGWLFYAETNFAPSNSIYHHFPALNNYVKNCQEILQNSMPDNDVLVYFPVQDIWHNRSDENLLLQLSVHNYKKWLLPTGFYKTISLLDSMSVSFDFISDNQLLLSEVHQMGIRTSGNKYSVLMVPPVEFIPQATLDKIHKLATQGVRIIFHEKLPASVSGYYQSIERAGEFESLINTFATMNQENVKVLKTKNLPAAFKEWKIKTEEIGPRGLEYLRSASEDGYNYFISNLHSGIDFSSYVHFEEQSDFYEIFDPVSGKRGLADTRITDGKTSVKLDLKQGASLFINTLEGDPGNLKPWDYQGEVVDTFIISGDWELEFIEGGPEVPSKIKTDTLISWSEFDKPGVKSFSGLAGYRIDFQFNPEEDRNYFLSFDSVKESVKIILNGYKLPVLFAFPFEMDVSQYLVEGRNELILEVVNPPANRIKNLDDNGVEWQIFHDINFVNVHYKPFSTTEWDFVPSGIIGRVMLIECN